MSTSTAWKRRNRPRRGVTLVEMLVVVALVVLMMVILVQIFQSALGAMSASRTTQELDVVLRSIDSMIRSDLAGVTANMTPPNNPALKQGYFEYGENSPADLQGEDTDDFLAFTTKAPEGQFFTGRQWLATQTSNANTIQQINQAIQPATISSQVAEVIYFWRNGNLYRRVFLVAPDRANSLRVGSLAGGDRQTSIFGNALNATFNGLPVVSWLGLNDISARPVGFTTGGGIANNGIPIPNDLGDLTNRENRAFRPRFLNDLNPRDGIPDDNNADGVNDYYPTMYYNGSGHSYNDANNNPIWSPNRLTSEIVGYPNAARVEQGNGNPNAYDVYAFPYIFPGMYSVPDNTNNRAANGLGWVHYQPLGSSNNINHAPLDLGDTPGLMLDPTQANQRQTWWGFPTWRESMAGVIQNSRLGWTDPIVFLGSSGSNVYQQPLGLRPIPPNQLPASYLPANLLPPIYRPGSTNPVTFFDGAGSGNFVSAPTAAGSMQSLYPNPIWEDDLILTNVRSFDVKAYDPSAPLYNTPNNGLFSVGYQDLGYGAASYMGGLTANNNNLQNGAVPFQGIDGNGISLSPVGFGHEGRIPPLFNDFRFSPKRYGYNVGEPGNPPIIRLNRTFDTWSTDYTNAPDTDILLNGNPSSSNPNPIYPSFPPPYPSTLRGIQVQIRVTDPRNERTKVLTIRHNFPR